MSYDVFEELKDYYTSVANELLNQASQAGLLRNPAAVGTEREELYRSFLERHVPKVCDVFLGGYVFDASGKFSTQMDVIVTGGQAPRFRLSGGNRFNAPLEGTIGIIEVKTLLNKQTLEEALHGCASIPVMPDKQGIVSPMIRIDDSRWNDMPYKIIFAYQGIEANTLHNHIEAFYSRNPQIPIYRRPQIIHVLNKYVVVRMTADTRVINADGSPDPNQPREGQYHTFVTAPDTMTMVWALNELQMNAFLSNNLMYKYDKWIDEIGARIQKG